MKVLNILKNRKYFYLALISAIIVAVGFPLLQVLATGGVQNFSTWFEVIPPFNLFLSLLFAASFGIFLSFQMFNLKSKVCDTGKKTASATGGGIAAVLGLIVPACPACLSIVTLFLPAALGISVAGFFLKYSSYLLGGSILLLFLGIYLLGGFKKY